MGGMIVGFDKIKALNLKNVVVFGVGMTVPSDEVAEKLSALFLTKKLHFLNGENLQNKNGIDTIATSNNVFSE